MGKEKQEFVCKHCGEVLPGVPAAYPVIPSWHECEPYRQAKLETRRRLEHEEVRRAYYGRSGGRQRRLRPVRPAFDPAEVRARCCAYFEEKGLARRVVELPGGGIVCLPEDEPEA